MPNRQALSAMADGDVERELQAVRTEPERDRREGGQSSGNREKNGQGARIAVMLPRFSRYGGVEQFGFHLAESLARRGHSVEFICSRQQTGPPSGVRIRKVPGPRFFKFLKIVSFAVFAERARRQGRYDCVIGLGKTWTQDIMRVGGGPVPRYWEFAEKARQGHGRLLKALRHRVSPYHRFDCWLEKKRYASAPRIVAVSHFMRDLAEETFAVRGIDIVYNKPDLSRFFPPSPEEGQAARAAYGIEPSVLAIGHAATNYILKGTGQLIRALALLPDDCHMYVAGGRRPAACMALARSLGVESRVHFVGRVLDMPGFLHAMDVFAHPTFYDPCSNAVVEALASGLPTLSSAWNGSAFFLPVGQVLQDPRDIQGMADILRLLREKALEQRQAGSRPGFVWPEDVPAGVDAFVDYVEEYIREKQCARVPGVKHA